MDDVTIDLDELIMDRALDGSAALRLDGSWIAGELDAAVCDVIAASVATAIGNAFDSRRP